MNHETRPAPIISEASRQEKDYLKMEVFIFFQVLRAYLKMEVFIWHKTMSFYRPRWSG